MKKRLLFVACLLLAAVLQANPVNEGFARMVGSAWLNAIGHPHASLLQRVETPFTEFYVFSAEGGGFVIVAADDYVRPILGYSLTGTFSADGMPANLRGWLEDYASEIAFVKQSVAQELKEGRRPRSGTEAVAAEWQRLAANITPNPPVLTTVSPLLTTTWNQSPLYNDMCPYDSLYNQHVVTGCVATATAQVMKFWNYPTTGYGTHSYHSSNSHADYGILSADFGATTYLWDSMPSALTSVSSQAQIDAVALLMAHVGIAVEMMYNVSSEGGSGSYNYNPSAPSAMSALVNYFKYTPDIVAVMRNSQTEATFCNILRAELDQNRPILYSGSGSSGGHSFVCDGYDQWGGFHFNWGWGGSHDGYFTIGALNPGYEFNVNNIALTGIRPNPNFGSSGTVTVTATGGNTTCTATGSGTYAFGDIVTLTATAGEGYRFAGWSDFSQTNPRTFTMNGGNLNFTARFEAIGSDTISYCGNLGLSSYWGEYEDGFDKYWGIRLPASSLTPGRTLTAVQFYVGSTDDYYCGGPYDMTIYTGTTAPTDTVFSTSFWVEYSDQNSWFSYFLPQAYTVEAGKSIWITFHNSNNYFPATITTSCGNPDGFLYGPSFNPDPEWNLYTFMIRGLFVNTGMVTDGDIISYCGDKPRYSSDSPREWGIMIPSAELTGRNYLQGVKLYVYDNEPHTYILHVYKGGADAPGTLVHSQPAQLAGYGWFEIMLDNTVDIGATDSLWITFSCLDGSWPANYCRYTGNRNSYWLTWWEEWENPVNEGSWLIQAVTSSTAPTLPPPTVIILGEPYVNVGLPNTYVTLHSAGTTANWSIPGGDPSTFTGDTVDITWDSAGRYLLSVSVNNSHGTNTDSLWVTVVDCDQAITEYPYFLGFETNDNMVCIENYDANNDGYTWYPSYSSPYSGNRTYVSNSSLWVNGEEEPIDVDNWVYLPKMATTEGNAYILSWYARSVWNDNIYAHYGVFIDTTSGSDPSHYVLLQDYTINDEYDYWWKKQQIDLSAYAGKTFRLAFRHYDNNGGITNLFLDHITVSETIPFFHEGDTISFCGPNAMLNTLGYGGDTYWGIKFAPSRLAGFDTLKSVLVYVRSSGAYTLFISQEGDIAPGTPICSVDTVFSEQYIWEEILLDTPIPLADNQPLWLSFHSTVPYPAAFTQFSGDTNSDWLSADGINWVHCAFFDIDLSWMIKAVVTPVHYTVTVHYNETMGAVTVDGDDTYGSTVTLTASAFEGYRFMAWLEDGVTVGTDSVYVISPLTRNVELTARFDKPVGIDEADLAGVTVQCVGDLVHVDGAEGMEITIYDVSGRELYRIAHAADKCVFRMPHAGVYLLKAGALPARRIVVIR